MEETNYTRKGSSEAIEDSASAFDGTVVTNEQLVSEKTINPNETPASETSEYPRTSYLQKLRLWRTQDLQQPNRLWSMVWRPIEFFSYPVIVYSGICYGCTVVWWTVLIDTASPILSAPPYNFSATSVG
jgi:hypothetical protein